VTHAHRGIVIAIASGWMLWHDVGIYNAGGPRLGGQTYAALAYDTEAACNAGRGVAIANEAVHRRSPLTETVAAGIVVWDASRRHYTMFRYRCAPVSDR
jgi:hypothetical protein